VAAAAVPAQSAERTQERRAVVVVERGTRTRAAVAARQAKAITAAIQAEALAHCVVLVAVVLVLSERMDNLRPERAATAHRYLEQPTQVAAVEDRQVLRHRLAGRAAAVLEASPQSDRKQALLVL